MKLLSKILAKLFIAATLSTGVSAGLANHAAAEQHSSRSLDNLSWESGGPGLDFALVWGDWTQGGYGMIVRIRAGHAAPRHSHTHDYHGVTIQGKWAHTYGDDDERTLVPGSYAFQSGKQDHGDRCEGPQDCLILIHQHGPRDFIISGN